MFHHPPASFGLAVPHLATCVVEIVVQRLVVGIADAKIAALVLLVAGIAVEEADRIGILGCDVEIAAYREMVETDEAA
ncbi:hypothetical protein [Oricola nitratireducens]|uniref:hypothetical protein n=1 Tax=Oricola nitratireducens TaxID=2775868 RepID=UPI001866DF2C|nr:hypothetical protein [Oricola nitratireducens]